MTVSDLFRHWKIILSMAAIFFFGLVTGSVITARFAGKAVARTLSLENWDQRTLAEYRRVLKLTPEQEEKIRPIIAQRHQELLKLRGDALERFLQFNRQFNEEIIAHLTSEQKAGLRAHFKEREARLRPRK